MKRGPLSLSRNASWAFLGQATFAACHWLGLIIIARLGGADELGRYALALAIVTPAMLFGGLQMRELQTADAAGRYGFRDYLAVRLGGTSIAALALLVVAWAGYAVDIALPILMVMIARAIENVSGVYHGLAHRRRRLDLVARSMMLRGALGVVALGVSYWALRDLVVALAVVAATRVLVLWFDRAMTAPLRPVDPTGPALERRIGLARAALPLGIASLVLALNPNIPRYFIEASAGLAALGLFTAMAHFVVAGRMVVTAVSQAAFPQLAELHVAADRASLRRLLGRLVMVSAVPGALGLVLALAFGREVLMILYGHEFAAGAEVFPWIMLVGVVLFAQTPFGYALTATQQIKVQPALFGTVAAINALGCLLLVPGYGIMGATLAWLASVVAQFTMSLGLYWRYHLRRPVAVLETKGA